MYLCSSQNDVSYENGKFHSAPFLVFLPEIDENGNCFYEVTVEPKNEWGGIEVPQNPPQPEKEPENPKRDDVETTNSSLTRGCEKTRLSFSHPLFSLGDFIVLQKKIG